MSGMKDYLKVAITAIIVCLATITTTSFVGFPKAQDDKIKLAEKNANLYTDKKIKSHEDKEKIRYDAFKEDLTDVKDMVQFMYELELKKSKEL